MSKCNISCWQCYKCRLALYGYIDLINRNAVIQNFSLCLWPRKYARPRNDPRPLNFLHVLENIMPSNSESDAELLGTMEGVWLSSACSVAYFQLSVWCSCLVPNCTLQEYLRSCSMNICPGCVIQLPYLKPQVDCTYFNSSPVAILVSSS